MKKENKDYFSRGSRIYTPTGIKKNPQPYVDKVEDSPVSTGFEQKDYKAEEELIEYNPGELMVGIVCSSLVLMGSVAMTLNTFFKGGNWKPLVLLVVVAFAFVITTIKEYHDPTN